MSYDPTKVPRPRTIQDYIDAYKANLDEARYELQAAAQRVRVLRDQGMIAEMPHPETKELRTVCKGDVAKKAWGEFVRWNSDWRHWGVRLAEAQSVAFRLPAAIGPEAPERTAADVARELGEWRARQAEGFEAEVG